MEIRPYSLAGLVEITPKKHGDARGFFMETYSLERMVAANLLTEWVQDNQSFSVEKHVLRGLHFQTAPFAQAKLVRVLKGSIFDVAVDLRTGSSTYGKWESCVLTAERANQFLVPSGFAHGFLTLEPETEVFYKVSARYAPDCDRSVRYDDPDIAITWPLAGLQPILSDKDKKAPYLKDIAANISF